MRYPSLELVLSEQERLIEADGGLHGVRDVHLLQSALGQPLQSFGGQDLYPGIVEKAAALGFFLISDHPFYDGNKRIGHEMMMWVLAANRYLVHFDLDEHEAVILALAASKMTLEELTDWLRGRAHKI